MLTVGQGPSWWLHESGEVLAWPGRYYVSLAFAEREAAAFKAAAATATFEILPAPGGWQWRAGSPWTTTWRTRPASSPGPQKHAAPATRSDRRHGTP